MKKKLLFIVLFLSLATMLGQPAAIAVEASNNSIATSPAPSITNELQFNEKNRAKQIFKQNGIQLEIHDYSVSKLSIGTSKVYLTLTNYSKQQIKLSLSTVAIGTQYVTKSTTQGNPPGDISKIPCLEKGEELSLNKCIDNLNKKLPTVIKTTDLFSPVILASKDNSLLEITASPGEVIRFSIHQTFWDESFRSKEWVKKTPSNILQALIDNTSGITENGKLPLNITITDTTNNKKISDFTAHFEVMAFTDERKFVSLHDIFNVNFEEN